MPLNPLDRCSSYPPGCTGPPDDDNLSDRREALWALLENADAPQYLIDLVDAVVADLEAAASAECPVCQQQSLEAEARFCRENHLYY